jgi:glycosyltransferase involved in cell wall biosynthesis/organic radical activating enzyme
MIVRDEDDVIGRCLDCARQFADEIIVVDTGSFDRTREIAALYTDKLYDFEWTDDFSAARNFSFQYATCDYSMWLDADDVIMPDSIQKIIEWKENDDFSQIIYFAYSNGERREAVNIYDDSIVLRDRLYHKSVNTHWKYAVHEGIDFKGYTDSVRDDILVVHQKTKVNDKHRNMRIFSNSFPNGLNAFNQWYYARELYFEKRYEESYEAYTKSGESKPDALPYAILSLRELRKTELLKKELTEIVRNENAGAIVFCELGRLSAADGDYQSAIMYYEKALQVREDLHDFHVHFPAFGDFVPLIRLAGIYRKLGNDAESHACFYRAAEIYPNSLEVKLNKIFHYKPYKEIWITPFSAQGIAVYYACLQRDMKVCGFIDGSERCKGVVFQGVPILSFEEYSAREEYSAQVSYIAIASTHYEHVFLRQLTKLGVSVRHIMDGIVFLDGQSIEYAIRQAAEHNIEALYPVKRIATTLLKTAEELKYRISGTSELGTSISGACVSGTSISGTSISGTSISSTSVSDTSVSDTSVLGTNFSDTAVPYTIVSVLEFVVTTRCNLKCRDCANLMQYYKTPSHIDTGTVLRSIDRVFQFIDFIVDVNLLGGEPLLNPDLPQILDKLGEYRTKIRTLNITTNGTILPKHELLDALIRNHAMMTVSDYGELSSKRLQLITLLRENGIGVKDLKGQMWNTPHTFCKNLAREQREIAQIFKTCSAQCMEVLNGKLSYCVFQAHAENLHAIPGFDYESLDLLDEHLKKEAVRELCYPSRPLRACRYCTGMNYETETIPAAVQTDATLAYETYD